MDDHKDETADRECIICYNTITDSTKLLCGHEFDTSCINTWIDRKRSANVDVTCPTCRAVIEPAPVGLTSSTMSSFDSQFLENFLRDINMIDSFPEMSEMSDLHNTSEVELSSLIYNNSVGDRYVSYTRYDMSAYIDDSDDEIEYVPLTQEPYINFSMWPSTPPPPVHDFGFPSSNFSITYDEFVSQITQQFSNNIN